MSDNEIKFILFDLLIKNEEATVRVASKIALPWREVGTFYERANIMGMMIAQAQTFRECDEADALLREQGWSFF